MGYAGKRTVAASGCIHNPAPSTARGDRRHSKRTEEQKKQAQARWNTKRNQHDPDLRPAGSIID